MRRIPTGRCATIGLSSLRGGGAHLTFAAAINDLPIDLGGATVWLAARSRTTKKATSQFQHRHLDCEL